MYHHTCHDEVTYVHMHICICMWGCLCVICSVWNQQNVYCCIYEFIHCGNVQIYVATYVFFLWSGESRNFEYQYTCTYFRRQSSNIFSFVFSFASLFQVGGAMLGMACWMRLSSSSDNFCKFLHFDNTLSLILIKNVKCSWEVINM